MVVLIGQKGPCVGFFSCSFFFLFSYPASPFPFVDHHGRASPYHAMLCMQDARERRKGGVCVCGSR